MFITDTLNHNVIPYSYASLGIPNYETYDNNCNWNYVPVISDTIPYWQGYYCVREDSIKLKSEFTSLSVPLGDIASFSIRPWYYLLSTNTENIKTFSSKIYPNPTTDFINIELEEEYFDVKLYNLLGQQVDFKFNQLESASLNLSSLPKGIYFLTIQAKDRKIKTVKIIKQ